jgi:hypothetical protein
MPKATDKNITTRRTFLSIVSAGIAAGATALAAVPALALPVDPIYSAIAAHREAIANFNTENAKLTAAGGPDVSDCRPAQAALSAECAAAKAVVATAPTTRAGLRALEVHLREDDSRLALHFIERPVTVDGLHMGTVSGGPVDWLIAKRAAELGIAG